MCVACLGSAGLIISVASIAYRLNFLFRFWCLFVSVIFRYFNLLMGILMKFTVLKKFLHSFGIGGVVELRS